MQNVCDTLYTADYVITQNDGRDIIHKGAVLIGGSHHVVELCPTGGGVDFLLRVGLNAFALIKFTVDISFSVRFKRKAIGFVGL